MKFFENKALRSIIFIIVGLTILNYFVFKTFDSPFWYWFDVFIGAFILLAVGYVILKIVLNTINDIKEKKEGMLINLFNVIFWGGFLILITFGMIREFITEIVFLL